MIDSVGYSEDGKVWMSIYFRYEEQPVKMVVTMSQEQAREVSGSLTEAADGASKFTTLDGGNGKNERDGTNTG